MILGYQANEIKNKKYLTLHKYLAISCPILGFNALFQLKKINLKSIRAREKLLKNNNRHLVITSLTPSITVVQAILDINI